MSDAAAKPELQAGSGATRVPAEVSIGQIFLEFLIIGATSFGGVVPYLRGSLWRTSIQQGLAPVTIGLLLSGCLTMAKKKNMKKHEFRVMKQEKREGIVMNGILSGRIAILN